MTSPSRETDPGADRRMDLRLFGHRGASIRCVENTIEAFHAALEDGANALELDVHATADGHFVVFHDNDGSRLAGDPRPIRALTLAEVQRWRLKPAASAVPTLAEVIEAFPGVPMSIDLKPDNHSVVVPFVEALNRLGATRWVTIASFHHRIMRAVHASSWTGSTALSRLEVALLRSLPETAARRFVHGSAAQIPRTAGPLRLDGRRFLERCQRLGLRADFWVVNDPNAARELINSGATGLMSDDPGKIAPVFREFERGMRGNHH